MGANTRKRLKNTDEKAEIKDAEERRETDRYVLDIGSVFL